MKFAKLCTVGNRLANRAWKLLMKSGVGTVTPEARKAIREYDEHVEACPVCK
jgi:hypothetical protein